MLQNSGYNSRSEFGSPQAELTDVISSTAEDQDCDIRVFLREEQDKLSARHLPKQPRDAHSRHPWTRIRLLPQMSGAESHKKSTFTCPFSGGLQVTLIPGGHWSFQSQLKSF